MNSYWCKKGHLNLDQADFIKQLVQQCNPTYVLETGFCTGRSASVILTSAKSLEKMMSIDINFDYVKPEGREYKKILEDNFSCFSTIEKNSKTVLTDNFLKSEFPNGIDWFTVDGDHSYDGCLFDLMTGIRHINHNGIIVVDDYKSGKPNGCHIPEVTKACDDFFIKYPQLEKTEWNCKGKGFCIFKKILKK